MLFFGAAVGLALIPVVGPWLSHVVDRVKNRHNTNAEIKSRADWYRNQVARTLHMDPANVTEKDFLFAAKINPMLARAVDEVHRKEKDENRFSLLTSAGASAVSVIPGVGAGVTAAAEIGAGAKFAAESAAVLSGGVGGGAIASLFTKDRVDPQEVIDVINARLIDAHEKGADPRKAVTPEMVFMLRVTQDERFSNEIKQKYGSVFHKLSEQDQRRVMQDFPALANASTTEAYAVGSGILPVQELMATTPNLDGVAAKYAVGSSNASFRQRVDAERAQAVVNGAPAV